MVYREPANDGGSEQVQRIARLHAEWEAARRRARLLLQAAGLTSLFLYFEVHSVAWIPRPLVRLGCTVWATCLLVWLAAMAETRWIARDLRRAGDDD